MTKPKILALFGESGAGKNCIQHWLTSHFSNMNKIIPVTTRPPRDYELNTKDYYFISQSEFNQLLENNEILEYTYFNNWYFGTWTNTINDKLINIGIFNPTGLRNLLKHSNKFDILPVWIKVNDKTRLLNSLEREKNPNCYEICRRFLTDSADFANIDFDYEIFLNNKKNSDFYGLLFRPKIVDFLEMRTELNNFIK